MVQQRETDGNRPGKEAVLASAAAPTATKHTHTYIHELYKQEIDIDQHMTI